MGAQVACCGSSQNYVQGGNPEPYKNRGRDEKKLSPGRGRSDTLFTLSSPGRGTAKWDKKSQRKGLDSIVFMATLDL